MFYECTSLITTPVLPAENAASFCYEYMFTKCNITEINNINLNTLQDSCCFGMFMNCKNITQAPQLKAKNLVANSYSNMFNGCSNLNSISVQFTEWLDSATTNWLKSTAATGTFNCPTELQIIYGDSNIPGNWTVTN